MGDCCPWRGRTARQPPAGPAVAALEVERGQERLTNGRARRGAAGQSARSPSGAVDRRHPESGSTRSGVGRDDLRGPPRLVEGRINEGSGFPPPAAASPAPRAAGSLGQLTARPGQTPGLPRGASGRAAGGHGCRCSNGSSRAAASVATDGPTTKCSAAEVGGMSRRGRGANPPIVRGQPVSPPRVPERGRAGKG